MRKLLIANRGEIAMRVARAARDLGIPTVAVYAEDDAQSRHRQITDEAVALPGSGPAAYLNIDAVIAAARHTGADAVHPGYGFLSERADFAQRCEQADIRFVGPTPDQLAQFGDKAIAIDLAKACQVPVMPSTQGAASLADIEAFFDAQGGSGIVIKAVGGGGGRGMRVVRERGELAAAYARCQSEAKSAFGLDAVYAERLVVRARHIEVQIVGDGQQVIALGERECTLQRRFQKLVEMAPSPRLDAALREQIVGAARRMATQVGYRSLGTFEFLVEENEAGQQVGFVFIEANPRLQVEHTVTEQVTGVDLVETQLKLAQGRSLRDLGLNPEQPPAAKGFSIQLRVNGESIDAQGQAKPSHGQLLPFDPPAGPGVRVDTHGYTGYTPSPLYDTLLAKLIVTSPTADFAEAVRRLKGALAEFRIGGVATNLPLLRALVNLPDFATQNVHTRYLETALPGLVEQAQAIAAQEAKSVLAPIGTGPAKAAVSAEALDDDTLIAVRAPTNGTLIELQVGDGDLVHAGQVVAVIESMKMQHEVVAQAAGRVVDGRGKVGDVVPDQAILYVLDPVDHTSEAAQYSEQADEQRIRPDLQRLIDRQAFLWDENRPEAVKRRRSRNQRTARENVADLLDDDGSFVEYGGLAIAAQAKRRSAEDLIANTPADGLITGVGNVNGAQVAAERARTAIMAYDATVLAGTQGKRNHIKTDRIVEVALRDKLPFVLFGEGGGGRPGDIDFPSISGYQTSSFSSFAQLSGEVPVVGIVSGRCFAGNAAFVGCCDVIIADKSSNIGLAGPAMIEGGGLGIFKPEDVGPAPVQYANGVIDVLVENETEGVAVAKHYLSFFQGKVRDWSAPNPLALRNVVPENRLRAYDSRAAIHGIADAGSVLMLREGFGIGIHTALARIEGRPVGIMANNPRHLGGAIDADAGDKAARFMQLCDAHGLPIVSLIDSPGFMVGPDIEAKAQVRHVSRMFVAAAKLRMPILAVTLRKCYGLGAMAMAGGGWHASHFTVSWPTGEYGPMGLEGAIQLGFKKELEAVPDGPERRALYDQLVAQMYERGHAINVAGNTEIDAVIDPADTRKWLVSGLHATEMHAAKPRGRFVDTW
ncbi:carbamoyl-phosphate synthase large subunit [Comamonas serinivorans]|uniref:Carbamoyl-phosphate synthase large subunit n=1 Tax=Comamonas serinivorans TaxID=1082851 RepID=A0A1Y0EIX5_9BURK|nr:carboxyl transferase domain-containing protein [Comamonas serinivorans]ARU03547.1 carbamoyl-phosphate synthase large subunit [Comamonas serinivorans]